MTLKDFKLIMISSLSSIYEMDELNSIFNLISEEYLKIPRSKLLLADEINLDNDKQSLFLNALERLKLYEPVQYVLGKANFMDLEFKVNNSVLIPRPETEELVRLMIKEDLDGMEILDIGTGSGCIAISLAKNLPNAKISCLDISEDAIKVAKENSKLNNVNIEFINADIFEYKSEKKYNIIVSNPPYLKESEKVFMKKNVYDHEPKTALFVDDNNPLIFYNAILVFSKNYLHNKGRVYFEINNNMRDQVKELANNYGYKNIECIKDQFGRNRFCIIN